MNLLRQVGQAMAAFYAATPALGVAHQVTTFTESAFGRSLLPGGTGRDLGWGSHHLVLGGAVRGGAVRGGAVKGGAVKGGGMYGRFPSHVPGGADGAGNRGVPIPSTSFDRCGATLARRFGVAALAMAKVFSNLGSFATADLGFMGV